MISRKPRINLERALNIGSLALIIVIGGALGSVFGWGEGPMARSAEQPSEKKAEPNPEAKTESKEAAAKEIAKKEVAGTANAADAAKEDSDEVEERASNSASTAKDACVTGTALDDLAAQRERLSRKEKELAQREAELKTLEASLKKEFSRLEQIRADMAAMDSLKQKENEEKVAKVIDTLQSMSPKAAAQMFAALDDALAVTAMQRMETAKIAKILNLLEPGRSARLTELMAGVVRARSMHASASNGAAGSPQSQKGPKKGGENNDGQNQQQQQSIGKVGAGGSLAKAQAGARKPAGE